MENLFLKFEHTCSDFTLKHEKMQMVRRRGLVVERRTPEREVGGSILTQVAVLCP